MKLSLIVLSLLLIEFRVLAQRRLCISGGQTASSIEFKAGEVDSFLHLDRYKVILFGEQHNGSFDPELEYYLLETLNKRYGMRHVFKELSVSAAWHFNQYLLSGDTSYLYRTALPCTYDQWPVFWERLYNYNKKLPGDSKFVIHGVDFERTEVFATIMELSPRGRSVPASLQDAMDTVAAHVSDKPLGFYIVSAGKMTGTVDNSPFTKTLRFVQGQLAANPEATKAYFGSNYPVIADIIANRGKVIVKPKPRNKTMFRAIRRIVQEQGIEKFVGIFGGQHITYTVHSSIANAARSLPGIHKSDILNIQELVYNLPYRRFAPADLGRLELLNAGCKATIWPADAVPGYRRRNDYVIVADALR